MVTDGSLIDDLMRDSGVGFGTSGARGLVSAMADRVCYAYTLAFLQHLRESDWLPVGGDVGIAGDLRASTPAIMAACAAAVADFGCRPRNFGFIASPAVACYGLAQGIPTLMVTGSHIPDDRNGIKFNRHDGEILKEDEQAIRRQRVLLPEGRFDSAGGLLAPDLPEVDDAALEHYVQRYLGFFPADCLDGLRVALYEHSSVARGAFHRVLSDLGAEVHGVGRSDHFVPVDTEAIRPEDVDLGRQWAGQGSTTGPYDAILSTDGDGDRPLVADHQGEWLRGDIAGLLCARYLGAAGVVTPVSSNTALEESGWFPHILRSRIGSPYVIEGMNRLLAEGIHPVVGYEANGGFLQADPITMGGHTLAPLPTRDALIVALAILALARKQQCPVAQLAADLPARFTASDRIKNFPTALSRERLAVLNSGDAEHDRQAIEAVFGPHFGRLQDVDTTDGLRIRFANGEIAHLRPSGNAPELRAYTEASSTERAQQMNRICMEVLAGWLSEAQTQAPSDGL